MKRKSLYLRNRKRYYSQKIKAEELNLNLRYQKPLRKRLVIRTRKIKPLKKMPLMAPIKSRAKRVRQQLAYLFKVKPEIEGYSTGFISIQAITINPDITKKGLLMAINEVKNNLQKNYGIDFSEYNSNENYHAPETTVLSNSEEIQLNDYKVHVQVTLYIKGRGTQGLWFTL